MNTQTNAGTRPLTDAEVAELDELLQSLPQDSTALDVAMLDGFMAALLLAPEPMPMATWLPWVFDAEGREAAIPKDPQTAPRTLELIQRRHNELAAYIAAREAFEPIIFEPEDDEGRPLSGKDAIAALEPWAAGFAAALDAFPGLLDRLQADDTMLAAHTGILRHLPPQIDDDDPDRDAMLREYRQLERDYPVADLDEATDLLVESVLTIADATQPRRPFERKLPKVGRNDPCPCGSGRKYKQCHGAGAV
mgnify:CR=1 FL=1